MEAVELTPSVLDQILGPSEAEENDEELLKSETEEIELLRLPSSAIEIRRFEDEIFHSPGLTWNLSCTYFAVPLPGQLGTFALIALNWDDNWERWRWEIRGGVSSATSIQDAVKFFDKKIDERHTTLSKM